MNNKNILGFLTAVTLSCFLCACNKAPQRGYRALPSELVRLFGYKPGTWWIYRDLISGTLDSVVVTEYRTGTYQSSTDDAEYILIIMDAINLTDPAKSRKMGMQLNPDWSVGFIDGVGLDYPFKSQKQIISGDTLVDVLHANLIINGLAYHNILERSTFHTLNPAIVNDTFAWHVVSFADTSVGFIKLDVDSYFQDPGTGRGRRRYIWELERWHIVR